MAMDRAAAFHGPGKLMEIKAYRMPNPEPGVAVVKTTPANARDKVTRAAIVP